MNTFTFPVVFEQGGKFHTSSYKDYYLKHSKMSSWVWFEDSIAYTKEIDPDTDFCEVQVLYQNTVRFQGKTTWSLTEESQVTSLSSTRDVTEHKITEIKYGIFIVDDGDEDYTPSSEESSEDDSDESSDYSELGILGEEDC